MLPFDLHVLSLPLAFILSQDQTLHSKYLIYINIYLSIVVLLQIKSNTLKEFSSYTLFLPILSLSLSMIFSFASQQKDCKNTLIIFYKPNNLTKNSNKF